MIQRCEYKRHKSYYLYGGRGITVHGPWHKFETFLADVGPRPAGTTLDRFPNRNGNYEPGNVRWATPRQQNENSSMPRLLTFRGETLSITDWAQKLGVGRTALQYRLKAGYSVERALSQPMRADRRRKR